jgi:hypothetical protein
VTTAVKIREDAKPRLEEIQAEIRLEMRETVTQQGLLWRLIDDADGSRDELIDSIREASVPLSEAEKKSMHRGRFSSGVETDERDIDDVLYG